MSIVSGIVGAVKGSEATQYAADKSAAAQQSATDLAKQIYESEVERAKPFYGAGVAALPQFQQMLTGGYDMKQSPAAQYQLMMATKAQNRAEASRGLAGSGGAVARLGQLNQSVAASDWNQQYNRILDALKLGTGASAQMGTAGNTLTGQTQTGATNLANIFTQAGQNQASLYSGISGASANTAATGINAYKAYTAANTANTAKTGYSMDDYIQAIGV